MDHVGSLFPTLPPKRPVQFKGMAPAQKRRGPRNERDEYLEYFFAKLKGPYQAFTKKPLTLRYLAMRISHLKRIQDLHYLRHICEDGEARGKQFSQVFWGSLKPRPDDIVDTA